MSIPSGLSRYAKTYRPTTSRTKYTNSRSNNTSKKTTVSSKAGMPTNIPKVSKPTPKPTSKPTLKPKSTPKPTPKTTPVASKAGMPSNIPVTTKVKTKIPTSSVGMPSSISEKVANTSASQKSNTTQVKKEDSKYAIIYKKPTNTTEKTSISTEKVEQIENINLQEGNSQATNRKGQEVSVVGRSVNELVRNGQANKIVLTENEPLYISTREGKRIRIDNGNYKGTSERNHRMLKIRKRLERAGERLEETENSLGKSVRLERENKIFSRVYNVIGDGSTAVGDANKTDVNINQSAPGFPIAGVENIFNIDGDDELVQINSPHDYEQYLINKISEEPTEKFYQKNLLFLQSKLAKENKTVSNIEGSDEEGTEIIDESSEKYDMNLYDSNEYYQYSVDKIAEINEIDYNDWSWDIDHIEKTYEANIEIYEALSKASGLPPELIAALHYRESGNDFDTYLHNGQPLGQPTTAVPTNINYDNFYEAAVHALTTDYAIANRDTFNLTSDSTDIAAMISFAERYNGLGYYNNGNVSPYVYSGTDVYSNGKYTEDGVYDPNFEDEQLGVYALIKVITEK